MFGNVLPEMLLLPDEQQGRDGGNVAFAGRFGKLKLQQQHVARERIEV
jgi:hypothetical protein